MGHTHEQPKVDQLLAIAMSANRTPRLIDLELHSLSDLTLDGERFLEHRCEDWLGFYDWLRTSNRKVIGLRMRVDESESPIFELLAGLVGVEIDRGSRELTVFLGENRDFQEQFSIDQDFGGNRLFIGDKGTVALAFRAPRHLCI